MRVTVVGATGNVGTSVLDALCRDPDVDEVVGVARHVPAPDDVAGRGWAKVLWTAADVVSSDLEVVFRGSDAVVHLAWLIQPSHREAVLRATNVVGSGRIFRAVAAAGVPTLLYASSVGAYGPGPKDRAVDESWPTTGVATSFYARHKSEVERELDAFEREHPAVRVVRLRPGLIFKREAASEIRRLFLGRLVPSTLLRREWIPVVPANGRLVFQVVHTTDVAEAFRLALHSGARGAFNLAADPVVDGRLLGEVLGARPVLVPMPVLRAAAAATWRLGVQPTPPGWVDLAGAVPVMATDRARAELGWAAHTTAPDAILSLLDGLAGASDGPTPALARRPRPLLGAASAT